MWHAHLPRDFSGWATFANCIATRAQSLTNSDLINVKAPAISLNVRRPFVVLSILLLAALLRVYAISLYPLAGDEYDSLASAKALGLNWNSIIYSGFMHFWIRLGTSELWLRLPSAIFGTITVAILFRVGERLGGWRTAVVAGLIAAISPFNLYHSQELRFYSFFMFASAAFMLATIRYVDKPRTTGARAAVLITGTILVLSHFLGLLALYAQVSAAVLAAKSRWSKRTLALVLLGLPVALIVLLMTPPVRHELWRLYHTYANAPSSLEPVMTSLSIVNLAKIAFAAFVMTFGYHVYPLRLMLVITGVCLNGFLLLAGARRLCLRTQWGFLPFAYLLSLLGIYVVLDNVGGRVAAGVSPRHVAFVWPVFLLLTAMGTASFKPKLLYVLVALMSTVSAFSIWSGWQKEWTYGISTDYRSAAQYASRWIGPDTALIHDGRSADSINFYFPKALNVVSCWPYLQNPALITQLQNQRLIFVTDDWEPDRRPGFDRLLDRLSERYSVVDGHVDYPLFEYVLDRKPGLDSPGYALRGETNQVQQPLSFYGLEFQDLRLPISVSVRDLPLNVIGAYALPDSGGGHELVIPLKDSVIAKRVILLTDVLDAAGLPTGTTIAELFVDSKIGTTTVLPLRMGKETTSWDQQCEPTAPCQTVFQWPKRIAMANQNSYEGALRDFHAGLHGVVLSLPAPQEVAKLTIRYTAGAGRFYVWGLALPSN